MWVWLGKWFAKSIGKWTATAIGAMIAGVFGIIVAFISSDPQLQKDIRCDFFPDNRVICPPPKPPDIEKPSPKAPPTASQSPASNQPPQVGAPSTDALPPTNPPVTNAPVPPPSPRATPTASIDDCIVPGRSIDQPMRVKVGSKVCSADGRVRATITDVLTYSISFVRSLDGRSFTCKKAERCSFGAEGPDFSISTVESNQSGERTAILVRN
jgi:hypothetical protein